MSSTSKKESQIIQSQMNTQTQSKVPPVIPRKYMLSAASISQPDMSAYDETIAQLSGPLRYSMCNDFMFKYSFQENLYALKGLLVALLKIPDQDIVSINILNPITLGDSPDDKNCILYIRLLLNNNQVINIEMQVKYQYYYPERSILYLCRCFDHLSQGENYDLLLPCVQISILDEEMFPRDDPRYTNEFYSEYYIQNRKTGQIFSDKFSLRMVSLKHLENADNKEELNGLYQWAKILKAETWEDLKMLANNNEYMKAMISGLKVLSEDEKVQLACEARERDARDRSSMIATAKAEAAAKATSETTAKVAAEKDAQYQPIIAEKDKAILEKDNALLEKDKLIAELQRQLAINNNLT